ncbi:MAG: GldG family protein, partial [Psychrosphaera sp.]|nr:GldG family protein [Psychrosphaera sp.]
MNRNYLAVLFGLGFICLFFGLGTAYVEQRFGVVTFSLSLLGLGALSACFIQRFIKRSSKKNKSTDQHSKSALRVKPGLTLAVILSMVLFVGINYFAQTLPFRWDVTQTQQHTLTKQTADFIKNLDKPVQLTALHVGLPPKYLEDLFKEYERISNGKVSGEIIDPIAQIGYASKFGNVVDGNQSKVIIQAGSERRDIDFTKQPLSEASLTNAIVRVTRAKRQVYFLTGHGEYDWSNDADQGLSQFAKLLNDNNIISKTLMLGITDNIPEDCDVLIIAGPRNELTEKEQTLIQQYLEKGGDALFLIENIAVTTADKPLTEDELNKNPSLNGILNQWGVDIQDDIVVDLTSHAGSDPGSPAPKNYTLHKAITEALVKGRGVLWSALDADTGLPLEGWGEGVPIPGFPSSGSVDMVADLI